MNTDVNGKANWELSWDWDGAACWFRRVEHTFRGSRTTRCTNTGVDVGVRPSFLS
jgi:hypothetical protein